MLKGKEAGEYSSLTVNAPHQKDWSGFLSQWSNVLGKGLSEIQLASIQVTCGHPWYFRRSARTITVH